MHSPIMYPNTCSEPVDDKNYGDCTLVPRPDEDRIIQCVFKDGMNYDPLDLIGKRVDNEQIKGEIIGCEYGDGFDLILEVLKDEA